MSLLILMEFHISLRRSSAVLVALGTAPALLKNVKLKELVKLPFMPPLLGAPISITIHHCPSLFCIQNINAYLHLFLIRSLKTRVFTVGIYPRLLGDTDFMQIISFVSMVT